MPGPWHLPRPDVFICTGTVEVNFTPEGMAYVGALCAIERARIDPASLARYGVAREHPGDPGPRPGELPWVGKAKKR